MIVRSVLLVLVLAAAGCSAPAAPTWNPVRSFSGAILEPTPLPDDVREERERQLAEARRDAERDPDNEDAVIWYARRLAYLGRYREALAVYSAALTRFPESIRLRRHRGHRFITVRSLTEAIKDFEDAIDFARAKNFIDVVEPDGLPNARNEPRSTTLGNVYYHLALARYLQGNWSDAAEGWLDALDLARNDDSVVAASYWLYLASMRADEPEFARTVLDRISADMDVIENTAYHDLLLLFRGERTPEAVLGAPLGPGPAVDPTRGYGVMAHLAFAGDPVGARAILLRVLAGDSWASFGYIAAEAEQLPPKRSR